VSLLPFLLGVAFLSSSAFLSGVAFLSRSAFFPGLFFLETSFFALVLPRLVVALALDFLPVDDTED
jgi:hypothetical protein